MLTEEKSYRWYKSQVSKLGNITPNSYMRDGKTSSRITPGGLYLFKYDPKLKKILNYYDVFPLVLPFDKTKDGFIGINLHYMPYMARYKLLQYLADYTNNDKYDKTTKVQISWSILKKASNTAPVKASVKKYLRNQVKSNFLDIPYNDWMLASQLPIDRFKKETNTKVWATSRKIG